VNKNDKISQSKSNESPVLKIVKLVVDLKETASENFGKLLNAKTGDLNKRDEVEIESTTFSIPTQLDPNDSSNVLLDNKGKLTSFKLRFFRILRMKYVTISLKFFRVKIMLKTFLDKKNPQQNKKLERYMVFN
jgi:hypothetical protein